MLCTMDATPNRFPDSVLPLSARRRLALDAEVDVRTVSASHYVFGTAGFAACRASIDRQMKPRTPIPRNPPTRKPTKYMASPLRKPATSHTTTQTVAGHARAAAQRALAFTGVAGFNYNPTH